MNPLSVYTVDVSNFLTVLDVENIINNLNYIFLNNLDCKDTGVTPLQTYPTLFENEDTHYCKLKQSFLYACSCYVQDDVSTNFTRAWAYKASELNKPIDRDKLWHTHTSNSQILSGVFYLKVNFNELRAGTEFSLDNNKFFIKPSLYSWCIFKSNTLHRPGYSFFKQDRLTIAADLHDFIKTNV